MRRKGEERGTDIGLERVRRGREAVAEGGGALVWDGAHLYPCVFDGWLWCTGEQVKVT